jgi:hypothetical protein
MGDALAKKPMKSYKPQPKVGEMDADVKLISKKINLMKRIDYFALRGEHKEKSELEGTIAFRMDNMKELNLGEWDKLLKEIHPDQDPMKNPLTKLLFGQSRNDDDKMNIETAKKYLFGITKKNLK